MSHVNGNQRREAIMAFITHHFETEGYAPSYKEIAQALGFKSARAVTDHLDILEAKGLITRKPLVPRSIRLTAWALDGRAQDHQRSNQRVRRRLTRAP